MSKQVFSLPGDGIGPEVVGPAVQVLNAAAAAQGVDITVTEGLVGGVAIDAKGTPLPEETLAAAAAADAVLLGGVGGPRRDDLPMAERPGTKPRLPLGAVLFDERYPEDEAMDHEVAAYDETMGRYYEERGKPGYDWSGGVAAKFRRPLREHLLGHYAEKGARFR